MDPSFHRAEPRNGGLLDGDTAGEVLVIVQEGGCPMEGVQGVADCKALGAGQGQGGGRVRGHDVFTHTHTYVH